MNSAKPVITLTTDFGHKGPFAAVMKGVIISRFRDAKVIDLTHDIPAQWPPEAGLIPGPTTERSTIASR